MSSLALRLIAENRSSRATFLDLGNCALNEIPAEVGDLLWLESLSLASEWYEWDGDKWQEKTSPNLGLRNRLRNLRPLARLSGLKSLFLPNTGVTDLSPLVHLTALQALNLSGTPVTDLSPLIPLASLQSLFLSSAPVTDLSPLANLSALRSLEVSGAPVTDLSPLAYLSSLKALNISRTQVTDLSPLAHLSALRSLGISHTPVTDLLPLAALSGLQSLFLSSTQVTDLSPLAHLSGLKSLNVSRAQVTDLSPLMPLTGLQFLNVSGTQVDLSILATLLALQTLDVSRTQVTDLSPLARLEALKSLNVSRTQVDDLSPLLRMSALQSLGASGTRLTNLSPLSRLSALQSLDVSGTQVADLSPLENLSALQSLGVSGTQVADLSPLESLSALQSLFLSGTQVADLSPLACLSTLQSLNVSSTRVTDLSPLSRLSALQSLFLSGIQVTDLSPLAHLSALQSLGVAGTRVTGLSSLAHLSALRSLDVSSTQVADLSPLAHLLALKSLNVSRTQVTDLSPIAHLTGLQKVEVWDTPVTDLSPLISLLRGGLPIKLGSKSWEGDGIYVGDTSVTNPPTEILAQGNDSVLNYFAERARGEVGHLYEAKMLILGEGGAGKTSLLRRLYQPGVQLPTEKETTKGIAIYKHEFRLRNGRAFRLNVWDFGGQQIYHATHQFFLTHRSLYVLVDDTKKDYKSVSDEGFKYWLELIEVFGGHSPILIFQNEKDDRSKAIDFRGIKQLYDNVEQLYAGNLERSSAADKVREGVEFYAASLSHIGEELPSRWIQVREEIEALAAEKPYVPVEEYFAVYGKYIEFDERKALLLSRYLHDLGAFLHFQDDPLLKGTVVLQNTWATEPVFRILDDEIIKKKLGRFNSDDCARLWKDSAYARKHLELLALMQNFELCYELRDVKPATWLAPQLLPPAKPEGLAKWPEPEDLVLRYKYEFLPKGIVSRLTVRLHRFVKDSENAWVTGVLFERDRTAVLVEILPSGNEIELRARGPEHKGLLSIIAGDLDALNESFKGLRDRVYKRIPCNCGVCRRESVPEFFDQKALLRRKELRRLKVECERSFEEVDVIELLEGIRMEKLPLWADDDLEIGSKAVPSASIRTIRLFLASSSELRRDRDEFDLYFRTHNDQLIKEGIYLNIVRWESFLDAMSKTRLQDEYNNAIRKCDIFVCLLFTKTGKFTQEEFDVAFSAFKEEGRPQIFTFFKNAPIDIDNVRKEDFDSLWEFKKKLKALGHFYTPYSNIEDLKLQFRDQLDRVLRKGETRSVP